MSETSIFNFPYGTFLMERLEFVLITGDELEAKILRVIEYEMIRAKQRWQEKVAFAIEAKKTPPAEPKEYWVRLSHTQIIAKLYKFDTAKVGGAKSPLSMSKTTLRRALNQLLDKKLIAMRSVDGDEFGATLYTLNRRAIQRVLDEMPKDLDTFSIFYMAPIQEGVSKKESGEFPKRKVGSFQFAEGEFPIWQKNLSNLEGGEFPICEPSKEYREITDTEKEEKQRVASSAITNEQSVAGETAAPAADLLSVLKNLSEDERKQLFAHFQQSDTVEELPENAKEELPAIDDKKNNNVKIVSTDHDFLAFDDAERPTQMTIYLTSKRWESELEDDRRLRVAQELQHELESQGMKLVVHVARASDESGTVEAETQTTRQEPPATLYKPAADASRTAEMVVALVEFLRGEPYTNEARSRELRAAKKLLVLQPTYSLAEIEEAWCHGSDDYWRERHAGQHVHVHDLVNTDSHGRYRIEAFLEHKRSQERRTASGRRQQQRNTPPPPVPATSQGQKPTMTEHEAHELIKVIGAVAEERGHAYLRGSVQQDGEGWIVRVSWSSVAWKGDLDLEIRSREQWNREFAEWDEIIQLRSKKRKGA